MFKTSHRTHIYRLGIVLLLFAVAFVVAREWAQPSDWNSDIWFRGGALADNANQPMVFGGISDIAVEGRNGSCVSCHADETVAFQTYEHQALSCESCHGALGDHVQNELKIADAPVDRSKGQCLNCHEPLISRPKGFPVFTPQVYMHEGHKETTLCLECHSAHDPTQ